MKIPENIQYIEVYYDARSKMCAAFREWVNRQVLAYPVHFFSYQSPRAEEWFRALGADDPERGMIVRADDGSQYCAAEGWVICLLSCISYQGMALRLSSSTLLPLAQKTCCSLVAGRDDLPKVFLREKDEEVADELQRMPDEHYVRTYQTAAYRNIPDGII